MLKVLQAAGAAILISMGLASSGVAAPGYATGNVNLRAGPGTDYPVVTTLAAGTSLTIHGCLSGYSWCDVTWQGNRGWVSSNYLQASYQNRRVRVIEAGPPIIRFNIGTYWGNYYSHRSWYRDRSRWEHNSARVRHDRDRPVVIHHRDRSRTVVRGRDDRPGVAHRTDRRSNQVRHRTDRSRSAVQHKQQRQRAVRHNRSGGGKNCGRGRSCR